MTSEYEMSAVEKAGSTGTTRSAAWQAMHLALSRQIAALEMLSAVQAITVVGLAKVDGNTDEARQRLTERVDELDALRRQRAGLERFGQIQPGAKDPR